MLLAVSRTAGFSAERFDFVVAARGYRGGCRGRSAGMELSGPHERVECDVAAAGLTRALHKLGIGRTHSVKSLCQAAVSCTPLI